MSVLEKIDGYLEARAAYEACHEASQAAYAMMKSAEYECVDGMLEEHVKSHGMDNGVHLSLRKQFTCSVTIDNENQIREWLTEWLGDDSEYIVEKVNKPALLEMLKAKEMEPQDAPDFLKLSTRPGITLRGWKDRDKE